MLFSRTYNINMLQVKLVYVNAAGFLSVQWKVFVSQDVPWPQSAHYVYTVNNITHTASGEWWGVYVCIQSVCEHVCIVCEHTGLPRICFWYCCVCTRFNTGVTVDTALLRRRLAVLLWADIRASMSSSASSSENSCGWQHLDLIKRETASGRLAKAPLYVAQFSTQQLCVGGCSQLP